MDGQPPNSESIELQGHQLVQFHINDIYVPEPAQILAALHGQDLLRGRIVGLSDHGAQRNAFAVIQVDGFREQVVVPVAKLVRRAHE